MNVTDQLPTGGTAMILKCQTTPIVAPFYFGLVTARFYETWDFYTEQLGFCTIDESDDFVRLVHPSGTQLGIMRHETNEYHPELVSATDGRGFWLNLDVADVDAEFERLRETNVPVELPLEAGQRGVRSFTVRDPNGVLIRIAKASVPDKDHAAASCSIPFSDCGF
jgi:catechol 2,3-dioxygenase-like lactoylglutathione lyase family enzyme